MSPLVQKHSLPVANGLLCTTCVQKLARIIQTVCCASDLRNGAPKPQTAICARGLV